MNSRGKKICLIFGKECLIVKMKKKICEKSKTKENNLKYFPKHFIQFVDHQEIKKTANLSHYTVKMKSEKLE